MPGRGGTLWGEVLQMGDGPTESFTRSATMYYCETCDKDLKSEEIQKAHFAEHIKCAYPGCKFEAHFLVSEKKVCFFFEKLGHKIDICL